MKPFWSDRIWDMYVDAFYAKIKLDEKQIYGTDTTPAHWSIIASRRFWLDDNKWRGY